MKACVVIGACFGDEGKGLTTDYLAAKHVGESMVVRFNGGAQAGHTVQTPAGHKHVFKHFGSGSLAGSPTYLSEFFICNPILFRQELEQLQALGLRPTVFVNPRAIVTTPYDMMINQIAEENRGSARHGSCGVGINETVERNLQPQFTLLVQDLSEPNGLRDKLISIQREWVYLRLQQLGIDQISIAWQERLAAPRIIEYFLGEVQQFLANCHISDNQILTQYPVLIFEGAQGLLLDEEKGFYPYVTRSATGLENVLTLAAELGIRDLEIFYVARAYLTRHGAGPLPHELFALPYRNIVDQTNVSNLYQGSLRFSWFNLDLLQQAIFTDLQQVPSNFNIKTNLLITCVDQLEDEVKFIENDQLQGLTKTQFYVRLQHIFAGFEFWQSTSPMRTQISRIEIENSTIDSDSCIDLALVNYQ